MAQQRTIASVMHSPLALWPLSSRRPTWPSGSPIEIAPSIRRKTG